MLLGSQYVGNEISDVRILSETPANPELPAIKECVADFMNGKCEKGK
ncbi:hypothetical protein MAH1_28170 [Sessilibacter sp. MAH1]